MRVFVVEDHSMTARALRQLLEVTGHEVEVATDVESALRLAGAIGFDVLVCDLNLPDGTGWDLMRQLCEQTPVGAIAFSAFNEPEHHAKSQAAGFAEHIAKGAPPEDLIAAISRVARG